MKWTDLISDVFLNLTRKKMRTALTMVGVVIGALAVVTTVSLGYGVAQFLEQQVRAVANPLTVEAWPKKGGSPDKVARGVFKSIGRAPQEIKKEKEDEFMGAFKIGTIDDEMREKLKTIEGVDRVESKVFVLARSVQLEEDAREFDTIVVPWVDAGPQVLYKGEVFSDGNASEAILSEAYLESFGMTDPEELLGKTLTIRVVKHPMFSMAGRGSFDQDSLNNIRELITWLENPPSSFELFLAELLVKVRDFRKAQDAFKALSDEEHEPVLFNLKIVGVAKKGLLTNIVYVPDDVAKAMGRVFMDNPKMYTKENWGMGMVVLADDVKDVPRIKQDVKDLGYRAITMEDVIGKLREFFTTLQSILAIFGGIAFFVATFSIVNTLLMAVMERKREIGVMQALGATRGHILRLFASEAAAIGFLGGLFGCLAGWLLGVAGNAFAHYKWGHIIASADLFAMPVWLVPGILLFTTLLGLAAGVYPAYRASRLDPVAALRYE